MYTSVITKAEKATLQEDGSVFLDVEFEILFEGEVVDTKRLAFAPEANTDDITKEIKAYIRNYGAEEDSKVVNEVREAETAKLDATIEDIIGLEITTK